MRTTLLDRLGLGVRRQGPDGLAPLDPSHGASMPAGSSHTVGGGTAAVGAPRHLPPATVIEREATESLSVRTGPAPTAAPDTAEIVQSVSKLAGQLVQGLDRWPGSVLVAAGVALVAATFGAEYFEGQRLGVVEFVAALAVGLCLAVAGAGVISRDVNRAQALAAEAMKSQERRAANRKSITEGGV